MFLTLWVSVIVVALFVQSFVYEPLPTTNTEETILSACFLGTTYIVMSGGNSNLITK